MPNPLKDIQEITKLEDLLSRELDVLENAISDENNALAICSREEIWKLVSRLREFEKKETLDMVLKEIEGDMIPKPDCSCATTRDKCDKCSGFEQRLAHNQALSSLKEKIISDNQK